MKVFFVEGRYKGNLILPLELIKELPDRLLLFTTVQYLDLIDQVKEQLRDKQILNDYLDLLPHSKYKYQVLGCGIKKINIDFDAFLYIGDGLFHPKALVLKNNKPCFCYNPIQENFFTITSKDIEKITKKQQGALIKFIESKNIGILMSTKLGQRWNQKELEKIESKFNDKNFYYLISDEISAQRLQDFNYIEVFVNTACPRIALDDYSQFPKPVLNISTLLEFIELEKQQKN